MNTVWIVLANAARARIFEAQGERKPREVAGLVHPGSRLKAGALTHDRAGHCERLGSDGGGSSYQPPTDPRQKQHQRFAHELAQAVHEGVSGRRCDTVMLVASNPFLGELRSALSGAVRPAVVDCVAKDLTELETPDLQRRLAEMLAAHAEKQAEDRA